MIPLIKNHTTPSPPQRHPPYSTPMQKIGRFEDFISLKSNVDFVYLPSDPINEVKEPEISPIELESQESTSCSGKQSPQGSPSSDLRTFLKEKKEILIPSNKRIQPTPLKAENGYERIFKQQKVQNSYIRVDYRQRVPRDDVYEATDKDLNFISNLNQQNLDGCENCCTSLKITQNQFERLIEAWEHETAFCEIITLEQAQLVASECIENEEDLEADVVEKIYGYWKSLRDQYQRPILRKYWKSVNSNIFNPNLAFQKRKENKFARRRSQRTTSSEDDFIRMKALKKNIDRGLLLISNTRYREVLKLEMLELQIKTFQQQITETLEEEVPEVEENTLLSLLREQGRYAEEKRKMEEDKKKGEIVLKSLKRLKKSKPKNPATAAAATGMVKRKLSLTQLSSSSMSTVTSKEALLTPMSTGSQILSSYLPKNVSGSFVIPIRKASIELNELKFKLTQSLGGLYLRNQELRVKVEVSDMNDKPIEFVAQSPENDPEELTIKIELEDQTEKNVKLAVPSTLVKYNINFHQNNQTVVPLSFDTIKRSTEESESNCSARHLFQDLSPIPEEPAENCKRTNFNTAADGLDGKIFNLCTTGEK